MHSKILAAIATLGAVAMILVCAIPGLGDADLRASERLAEAACLAPVSTPSYIVDPVTRTCAMRHRRGGIAIVPCAPLLERAEFQHVKGCFR